MPALWKRVLLCFLRFRRWRVAGAYNTVVCDLFNRGEYDRFGEMQAECELAWARVFGDQSPATVATPPKNPSAA